MHNCELESELGGHWVYRNGSKSKITLYGVFHQNEIYELNIDNLFYPEYRCDLVPSIDWLTG